MKIIKGDNVLVISGKDKGKKGKVLRSFPQEGRILVEGINIRKKHVRPKRSGEKGQTVERPFAFEVSNAKLICPKCKNATRVGYIFVNGKKERVCKKCKQEL